MTTPYNKWGHLDEPQDVTIALGMPPGPGYEEAVARHAARYHIACAECERLFREESELPSSEMVARICNKSEVSERVAIGIIAHHKLTASYTKHHGEPPPWVKK